MKKSILTTLFSILFACTIFCQDISKESNSTTRAVIVGISDYQNPEIPDLKYAHHDAEALASWLQSPGGGRVSFDNIKLLTNENATGGQFSAAMAWLREETKEGDRVVIYFSGHGDMEAEILGQLGFLLFWDSPAHSYMMGALSVDLFKTFITTLSTVNRAKVIVIADACRAGKLAGNNIIGTRLTNASLSQQFANEQKILSCQADEYSIEGAQWGNGRGVFSWHLLNGLYGLADKNGDRSITLLEIKHYLEDRVSRDVQPLSQIPLTVGDKTEVIGQVEDAVLAKLKKGEGLQQVNFSSVAQRGMVEDVFAKVDTSIVELYLSFQKALEEKRMLEPVGNCAEDYYKSLLNEESIKLLHNYLRHNYAAALQDDAQQVMNKWLDGDIVEIFLSKTNQADKYRLYPYYLARAAELLGSDHYMYPILKARKLYFEGYLMDIDNHNPNRELGEQILMKYRQSLKWQPNSPQTLRSMASVHFYQMMETDSAEFYTERAMELAPSWIKPYSNLGFMYCGGNIPRDMDKARHYLEFADKIDTITSQTDIFHINNWGIYLWRSKQYEKAIKALTKAIALDSTQSALHNTLGVVYWEQKKRTDAEEQFKKAIRLDSTNEVPYHNLGYTYTITGRYDEAEALIQKSLDLDSTNLHTLNYLGFLYLKTRRFKEAELVFEEVILLDPTVPGVYGNLGMVYVNTGRFKEAEEKLLKAIQIDSSMAVTHGGLGTVYMSTMQFGKAEEYLKKSIQLDSTSLNGYFTLAMLYGMTRKTKKAEELSKKMIRLDPSSPMGYSMLGQLYSMTKRIDEAEQLLKKAIQLDSTFALSYGVLGSIYQNAERWEDAEKLFIKVIQLDDSNVMGYASLGVVYQNLARWEESATMFQKTLKSAPPFLPPFIYGSIGNTYTHVPELIDQAGPMLDKALKMNPYNPDFYIYKAQLAIIQNQTEEAWQYLEQGLEKSAGTEKIKYTDLQSDPDFEEMRKEVKWGELMKKYFPEQFE